AGLEMLHRLGRVSHHLDPTQCGAACLSEAATRVGKPHPSSIALQQLQSDRPLEVPDLLRDRSLSQEEGCRRAGDVLVLGDRHERAELLQGEPQPAHADILVGLMESITNY